MTNDILFSIIIPVYNAAPYLDDCLASVLRQTEQRFQVICVDDGSTDGSLDILKRSAQKDPRFVILTQSNKGAGVARNRALTWAKGTYVKCLDADDKLRPNALAALRDFWEQYPSADMCLIVSRPIDMTGKELPILPDFDWIFQKGTGAYPADVLLPFYFGACNGAGSTAYRRNFLNDQNIRFLEGVVFEDVFILAKSFLTAQTIGLLPQDLYLARQTSNSVMRSGGRHYADIAFVWDQIEKLFTERGLSDRFAKELLSRRLQLYAYFDARIQPKFQKEYRRKLTQSLQHIPSEQINHLSEREKAFFRMLTKKSLFGWF